MGSCSSRCGKDTVTITETENAPQNGVHSKSFLSGSVSTGNNSVVTELPVFPPRDSAQNTTMSKNRRESEETVWFDAIMDRFPSQADMLYPPTDSMRQLPADFDMERTESLRLLLNSSFGASAASSSSSNGTRPSVALVSKHLSKTTPGTQGRGYPGELTEAELETCLKFREELKKRDPAFKEMVMAMHPYEAEAFALCRVLRSRDFDLEETFAMLQEHDQPEVWNAVKQKDPTLYKEFEKIPEFNGCPFPVFLTQLPAMESGIGKNGSTVLYYRIGKVSIPGIECIVGDLANAVPFTWRMGYHGCREAMEREIARADAASTTVLAEKIMIVDFAGDGSLLSNVTFGQEVGKPLICFPESVNCAFVVNAPMSLAVAWAAVKKTLDERTVQKFGVFRSIPRAKTVLDERIDSEELSSCYGGKGPSFDDIVAERQREFAHKDGVIRYVGELLTMTGRPVGFDFDLATSETIDSIVVYSRSDNMCEISVVDGKSNKVVDSRKVSREHATSKVSFDESDPEKAISHNNYAVEIASMKDFDNDASGSFSVKAQGGTRGDHFLVAISFAEKKPTK
eukprot:CAMPEP_0116119882 /NCGR_PEP_ID=MMETSP0329-20121206/2883_1 /TAXON_ID=697910 /ORGANISM="Pseudo-nitzschia arenysensis, Strain B593" /LENGTH=568 /DNA_ID=CAMNT_0003613623 /DNA_START=61 /DNA_END=1767 /DNA_ORIENTATION=-